MVLSADLAKYFHDNYCVTEFIPRGIHKPHEYVGHLDIWSFYADRLNEEGLENSTPEEVVKAFFDVLKWNYEKDPWPGHPSPDLLIGRLKK